MHRNLFQIRPDHDGVCLVAMSSEKLPPIQHKCPHFRIKMHNDRLAIVNIDEHSVLPDLCSKWHFQGLMSHAQVHWLGTVEETCMQFLQFINEMAME